MLLRALLFPRRLAGPAVLAVFAAALANPAISQDEQVIDVGQTTREEKGTQQHANLQLGTRN